MDNTSNGRDAVRAYYGLAIAALVLPLLVIIGGGWLAWQSVLHDARQGLGQALAVSTEQASKVLDTQTLVAARVNDLLNGLDDAAVTAQAPALRARIAAMIRPFPQIGAVIVSDSRGQVPLATPGAAAADGVAGSGWFRALQGSRQPVYVTAAAAVAPAGRRALSVARRRGHGSGPFQGVVLVAAAPRYFSGFGGLLFDSSADCTAGLYRDDGMPLAQYPAAPSASFAAPSPNAPLMAVIAHDPAGGILRGRAPDGVERLIAYRKLAGYPIYATIGRSWHSIAAAWRTVMATYLAFGVPPMIGLFALSLLAARRARRESDMLAALQAETRRRAQAEDALRQAQKLEAVGRLTGGIAHDFNNHLTVISSNVELLKRRLPNAAPELERFADAAMQGVRRAATLTQRLLAFSRQQALDPEPLDAGQLVTGMLDLMRRTLGESVAVQTALAGGLWLTQIDANQLESALLSLAVNAQDAMPAGGTLTIETANVTLDESYAAAHAEVTAGPYVMIAVSDTGIGMAPDVQARAFEPFFTTKPFGQGTGLGLSMVYGFVHQSGGHVRIDTASGEGATIRLYLPRYVQPPPPLAMAPAVRSGLAAGSGETVLVVEDDETVRRTAAEALRDIGYQVLEAPDAMEAVRLLADRGGIDLLFTDVGLPGGVNGRALADAAQNINPALRVLFTTGYRDDGAAGAGAPFGEIQCLAKPFSLQQLEAKIREVLDAPVTQQAVVRTESA